MSAPQSRVVENGGSLLGKVSMPFRPYIPKSEHAYADKQQKKVSGVAQAEKETGAVEMVKKLLLEMLERLDLRNVIELKLRGSLDSNRRSFWGPRAYASCKYMCALHASCKCIRVYMLGASRSISLFTC